MLISAQKEAGTTAPSCSFYFHVERLTRAADGNVVTKSIRALSHMIYGVLGGSIGKQLNKYRLARISNPLPLSEINCPPYVLHSRKR